MLRVLKQAVLLADPTAPADEIHVGTHNLRKFAYSLAFIYFECSDLQTLCDRAGSRSMSNPMAVYIRNIPGDPFYVCTPLGTLKPGMPRIRGVWYEKLATDS